MLTPIQPREWDLRKAAHLLNRAGFGGTPEEIKAFCELGMAGAVNRVLDGPDDSIDFPKPLWAVPLNTQENERLLGLMAPEDRKAVQEILNKTYYEDGVDLVRWWLERMRFSANPFREKMTLFWHGHFATSVLKVRESYLMWQQNELLRAHAFGNFGLLLKAVSRDPAMEVWLDTRESKRDHPNENFARELMELFALGIGNYTEQDVKEAARAFTGYRINPINETFRYEAPQHDNRQKTFLGRVGPFTGDDAISIILEQPACARFIARKLWRYYVEDDPEPALVEGLAGIFREGNYEVRPLMGLVFQSREFYSEDVIRSQIKSPVQWLVQTGKILDVGIPKAQVAVDALKQLGQVPFAPPNVKGWDGGRAWITTSTLLSRYNLSNLAVNGVPDHGPGGGRRPGLAQLGNATGGGGGQGAMMEMMEAGATPAPAAAPGRDYQGLDLAKVVPAVVRSDPRRLIAYLAFRLYQEELPAREAAAFEQYAEEHGPVLSDGTLRELLHLMMSTPRYQLT